MQTSPKIQKYFDCLDKEVKSCYNLANKAREKGVDPEKKVDIPLAKGIAQRVEGLISAEVPQILGSGVAERIKVLEKEYGLLDWRVALKISEEISKQKFIKFDEEIKALETGIRVGLAYITLGVISAPLEGFIELKTKKRNDGKDYLAVCFAGPIRAAGGTASAVTLVIADYVRLKCGYGLYDPNEKEVKRCITEVRDYHDRSTNLQYNPSDAELGFLLNKIPVQIDGERTEDFDVSNYKDLPRIETNGVRSGMCLVLAEGIAQKATKVYKNLEKWGRDFGLDWEFLSEFITIQKKTKAEGKIKEQNKKITPNYTFIKDIVAGRPVLAYPMKFGGLRLRYGRTRTTGLAATALHPNTMRVLDEFIAIGTQLKFERPGKATTVVSCDTIAGPIVLLKNGDVVFYNDVKDKISQDIEKILFLGDILVSYGDFYENGHTLVPPGYCREWWIKDLEKSAVSNFGKIDVGKISDQSKISKNTIKELFLAPLKTSIKFHEAMKLSKQFSVPLHPDFIYYYKGVEITDLKKLKLWFDKDKHISIQNKIVIKNTDVKHILEKIGVPHRLHNNFVIIENNEANVFQHFFDNINLNKTQDEEDVFSFLSDVFGVEIRDKAGVFVGARMGRPEKAKMRKLTGSPHVLFPVGNEGGRFRSLNEAMKVEEINKDLSKELRTVSNMKRFPTENRQKIEKSGKVTALFPIFLDKHGNETIFPVNLDTGEDNIQGYWDEYKRKTTTEKTQDSNRTYRNKTVDVLEIFEQAIQREEINKDDLPKLVKGVKGTSNKNHLPENIVKGILRAKHGVYVNKDGTTRYDMIEVPITHFKPKEVQTSIKKLKELGYLKDIHGTELKNEEQVLELFPQDLILPGNSNINEKTSNTVINVQDDNEDSSIYDSADSVLYSVSKFVDEELTKLYKQEPYYNLEKKEDIIGHLVIGLAPHTSAGIVGRVIGFSKTQGMFAHPMYHAAMRRNCDGDEACVILLMDALLNFSRSYLPDKRGSRTMDAPLVLTSMLLPGEVDDEVHGMDIAWNYPLEFYENANNYKNPSDIEIVQLKNVIGKSKQYEGLGYTHEVSDINFGVVCSKYKTLPSMIEKLEGQMKIAEKVCSVNETDVAELVINKHFLKDIKGNLRKFSTQRFRCVKCNKKYRRTPLIGKCVVCGGKIIFTISEGSIIKYLEPTLQMAEKYEVSKYIRQTLDLLEMQVQSILGMEEEKQEVLGKWK